MSTFHARLLELESELIAKEESAKGIEELTPDCVLLLESVEDEIGVKLGDQVPKDWRGWLSYYRSKDQLFICRGRAFKESGMFGKHRAGCDVAHGLDSVTEYRRGFDVTPPQDLDHLLVNFGGGNSIRVFLWYGENISPYRLIFEADMADEPHHHLKEAVIEACVWIIKKPKELTLPEYIQSLEKSKGEPQ
ncbi:MAG: hypothetical protein K8F91_11960 [Candidatus Obscuribacterales bacterium]|nr:hypothetical protein [Candidatus Obscuribacterales bacterium]